jgi:large subunit ribosomal protein L4
VFDVQTNVPLIHQVVVAQLAAARQGTHSTKTAARSAGGGRKPYRQKGTGRARQGSTARRSSSAVASCTAPQPRDYSQRTPKKMKAAALRGALSDRAATAGSTCTGCQGTPVPQGATRLAASRSGATAVVSSAGTS